MSAMSSVYLAFAEQSRAEAEKSTLANVREKCLRSAAAWQAMGARARLIETRRDERVAAQQLAQTSAGDRP